MSHAVQPGAFLTATGNHVVVPVTAVHHEENAPNPGRSTRLSRTRHPEVAALLAALAVGAVGAVGFTAYLLKPDAPEWLRAVLALVSAAAAVVVPVLLIARWVVRRIQLHVDRRAGDHLADIARVAALVEQASANQDRLAETLHRRLGELERRVDEAELAQQRSWWLAYAQGARDFGKGNGKVLRLPQH